MHTYVDVEIYGSKACKKLKDVLVDTGATFTTITQEDADEVGISITIPRKFRTAKEDSEFPIGATLVRMKGKEMWNPIMISKEGRRMIGALSLEALGFKVDPIKGVLEDPRLPMI